jgi:hypothetical protein
MSQYQNFSSGPSKPPEENNNRKKLIITGIIAGFLVLVISLVGLSSLFGSDNNTTTSGGDSAVTVDTDLSSDQSADQELIPVDPENPPVQLPEIEEEVSEKVQEQRQVLNSFQSKKRNLNVATLVDQPLNTETVNEVRAEYGDEMPVVERQPGKIMTVTVDYNSVGDQNFEKGSVYVKLSNGLRVVEDSMKDTYKNGAEISVSNSVYDQEKNLIKYGPGSTDQATSNVSVGDEGKFTFSVEITEPDNPALMISSYIMEEGSNRPGKPGIIFID